MPEVEFHRWNKIEELSLESLRDQISYGQEITLFNDTIFNNIFYGDIDTSEEDVYEAAKKANAHQCRIFLMVIKPLLRMEHYYPEVRNKELPLQEPS